MKVKVKISALVTWALLLVLSQMLITQWTVHAAGNRSVIDYISFAGTVVGMILAILAIVYSFIANASQKSDSEILRGQLSSLNDAIAQASASGNQFSSELTRLEDIRESLSQVASTSAESLAASSRLEESVEYLRKQSMVKDQLNTNLGKNYHSALEQICSRALAEQIVTYYLSLEIERSQEKTFDDLVDQLLNPIYVDGNISKGIRQHKLGEVAGYNLIFDDLRVFSDESNLIQFKKYLLKRARLHLDRIDSGKPENDNEGKYYNPANLAISLNKVAERLQGEIG